MKTLVFVVIIIPLILFLAWGFNLIMTALYFVLDALSYALGIEVKPLADPHFYITILFTSLIMFVMVYIIKAVVKAFRERSRREWI